MRTEGVFTLLTNSILSFSFFGYIVSMKKKTVLHECNVSIHEEDDGFVASCEELDIECYGNTPEEALERIKN